MTIQCGLEMQIDTRKVRQPCAMRGRLANQLKDDCHVPRSIGWTLALTRLSDLGLSEQSGGESLFRNDDVAHGNSVGSIAVMRREEGPVFLSVLLDSVPVSHRIKDIMIPLMMLKNPAILHHSLFSIAP
jgi:hypothetical protein